MPRVSTLPAVVVGFFSLSKNSPFLFRKLFDSQPTKLESSLNLNRNRYYKNGVCKMEKTVFIGKMGQLRYLYMSVHSTQNTKHRAHYVQKH